MTTALSPDRMTLAMMIFHSAAPERRGVRSGITNAFTPPASPGLPCRRIFIASARSCKRSACRGAMLNRTGEETKPHGEQRRLQQDVSRLVDGAAPRRAGAGLAAGRSRAVQGTGGDHARRAGAGRHHRPRAQPAPDRHGVLLDLRPHGARRQGRAPEGHRGRAGQGQGLADRRRPGRHRRHRPRRARAAARGAFRHGLCQARRPADGRQLHHRGEPGHLDPVPVGPGGGDGQDDRRVEGRASDEVLRHPRAQGHRLAHPGRAARSGARPAPGAGAGARHVAQLPRPAHRRGAVRPRRAQARPDPAVGRRRRGGRGRPRRQPGQGRATASPAASCRDGSAARSTRRRRPRPWAAPSTAC